MTGWKIHQLKMYFLLKIDIFQCHCWFSGRYLPLLYCNKAIDSTSSWPPRFDDFVYCASHSVSPVSPLWSGPFVPLEKESGKWSWKSPSQVTLVSKKKNWRKGWFHKKFDLNKTIQRFQYKWSKDDWQRGNQRRSLRVYAWLNLDQSVVVRSNKIIILTDALLMVLTFGGLFWDVARCSVPISQLNLPGSSMIISFGPQRHFSCFKSSVSNKLFFTMS